MDAAGNLYTASYDESIIKVETGPAAVAPGAAVGTLYPPPTTVYFNVTGSGTLGTPVVLTQGAPNLDFTLGTGSTCTGSVSANSTCTVNVAFTPQFPGQRLGAINLTNSSGTVIATALISGTGTGPLGTFSPGTISTVAGNGTECTTSSTSGCPGWWSGNFRPAFGSAGYGRGRRG